MSAIDLTTGLELSLFFFYYLIILHSNLTDISSCLKPISLKFFLAKKIYLLRLVFTPPERHEKIPL